MSGYLVSVTLLCCYFLSFSRPAMTSESKPQFIFMEIMRRRLEQRLHGVKLQQTLPSINGRQKIASAIEPSNTTGNR